MNSKTKTMVGVGLLTAIVVVLQLMGTPLKLGMFAGAVALLPIVVGAGLYGWKAGAWLGFAFGMTVLLSGDAAPFLAISIPGTILTVLAKGSGCGAVAGLMHKLLAGVNKTLAAYVAAIVAPIVNSGIFALGCYLFFYHYGYRIQFEPPHYTSLQTVPKHLYHPVNLHPLISYNHTYP